MIWDDGESEVKIVADNSLALQQEFPLAAADR
jgi:hypothetical protein